jgi:hypothetical protein
MAAAGHCLLGRVAISVTLMGYLSVFFLWGGMLFGGRQGGEALRADTSEIFLKGGNRVLLVFGGGLLDLTSVGCLV